MRTESEVKKIIILELHIVVELGQQFRSSDSQSSAISPENIVFSKYFLVNPPFLYYVSGYSCATNIGLKKKKKNLKETHSLS